jgi:hypothetical protein
MWPLQTTSTPTEQTERPTQDKKPQRNPTNTQPHNIPTSATNGVQTKNNLHHTQRKSHKTTHNLQDIT